MKAVPALLEPTIEGFSHQLEVLMPHFSRFSIDVEDGRYVSSQTESTWDLLEFFSKKAISKEIIFDFDLMTYSYEKALENILLLQKYITVDKIFVHRSLLKETKLPTIENLTIGLALDTPDEVSDLHYFGDLNSIPSIQIMTIHAGPQGQAFLPEMLKKVGELRSLDYRSPIYIDGGINEKDIPGILAQKDPPDFACIGSFLTKAGDELPERIAYLKSMGL